MRWLLPLLKNSSYPKAMETAFMIKLWHSKLFPFPKIASIPPYKKLILLSSWIVLNNNNNNNNNRYMWNDVETKVDLIQTTTAVLDEKQQQNATMFCFPGLKPQPCVTLLFPPLSDQTALQPSLFAPNQLLKTLFAFSVLRDFKTLPKIHFIINANMVTDKWCDSAPWAEKFQLSNF